MRWFKKRESVGKVVYVKDYEPSQGRYQVDMWNDVNRSWQLSGRFDNEPDARAHVDWLTSFASFPRARVVDCAPK